MSNILSSGIFQILDMAQNKVRLRFCIKNTQILLECFSMSLAKEINIKIIIKKRNKTKSWREGGLAERKSTVWNLTWKMLKTDKYTLTYRRVKIDKYTLRYRRDESSLKFNLR